MRKKEIKGFMHDLLRYLDWKNPLSNIFLRKKIEVDFLKKEVLGCEEDDIWKFYHEKINWFHKRIKEKETNLGDFKKAVLYVYGAKEKIEIIFKDSEFSDELVFGKVDS